MRCLPPFLSLFILTVILAAPTTSHRTDNATFREEVSGLTVFAGSYPASNGADDAYVPIPVAVALMRNGASVAFTPESFTLADAEGNRVPAAGFVEVKDGYSKLAFDRSLMRTWPINVGMTIASRPRIPSNFYPPTGAGTRISRVELAPFSWFSDVVYFPRPPAGLASLTQVEQFDAYFATFVGSSVGDGQPDGRADARGLESVEKILLAADPLAVDGDDHIA